MYLTWNKATPGQEALSDPHAPAHPPLGARQMASMFSLHDVTSSSDGRAPHGALAGQMTAHKASSQPNRAKADGGSRRTRTSDLTLIRRAL